MPILFKGMSDKQSIYSQTGQRKYLNTRERRLFFQVTQNWQCLEDQTFAQTLLYTGCRISEALELTPQSIDYSEQTLIFRTLKQRQAIRYRAIPVPKALLDNILRQINETHINNDSPLWWFSRTTGYNRIKDLMKEAGIKGEMAMPKGLRHTYAINCIQEKIDFFRVKKWMGHTKAEATSIYLDFVGEDERRLAKRTWNTLV